MKQFGAYPPNSNTDPLEEIWAQERGSFQNRTQTSDQKTREICDEVAAAINNSSGEELAWNIPSTGEKPRELQQTEVVKEKNADIG